MKHHQRLSNGWQVGIWGGERGGNRKIDNPRQTTFGENVHIPSSRVLKYCLGI